jgi:hypothetical protein
MNDSAIIGMKRLADVCGLRVVDLNICDCVGINVYIINNDF